MSKKEGEEEISREAVVANYFNRTTIDEIDFKKRW
jgi:hypothetical protein